MGRKKRENIFKAVYEINRFFNKSCFNGNNNDSHFTNKKS